MEKQYEVNTQQLKPSGNHLTQGGLTPAGHELDEIVHVYDLYNRHRTNSMVRSPVYWRDQLRWRHETLSRNFYVAIEDGEITAYLRLRVKDAISIDEAVYKPGHEDTMVSLFEKFSLEHPGQDIELRIPDDHALARFSRAGRVANFIRRRDVAFLRLCAAVEKNGADSCKAFHKWAARRSRNAPSMR
ncbi:hypothetical protein [Alicyclobacillus fastidiosus]|uniref:hypothetical protein n=1 Tax=Alicyclobacillus fastidiosus TaxID=392011 RepID=UPI0024E12B25|nr:hypothetical protein [Alicyclobacillus fastidiosus]